VTDWQKRSIIDRLVPKDKKEFSRDAVEILIGLALDKATETERHNRKIQECEDRHGPQYI
jgi:hypothetical protein